MKRRNIASKAYWEPIIGYSRLVCVGPFLYIAGTTATNEMGTIVGRDDPYAQAVQIIRNIESALAMANASLRHVVRTRIYVTNIKDWREVGRAHHEFFGNIRPACSIVEVNRFIVPEILVEIEAEAIISY